MSFADILAFMNANVWTYALAGPALFAVWVWTVYRVARLRRGLGQIALLGLCLSPVFHYSDGDTHILLPVLFPLALIASFFLDRRPSSARSAVERASGG